MRNGIGVRGAAEGMPVRSGVKRGSLRYRMRALLIVSGIPWRSVNEPFRVFRQNLQHVMLDLLREMLQTQAPRFML